MSLQFNCEEPIDTFEHFKNFIIQNQKKHGRPEYDDEETEEGEWIQKWVDDCDALLKEKKYFDLIKQIFVLLEQFEGEIIIAKVVIGTSTYYNQVIQNRKESTDYLFEQITNLKAAPVTFRIQFLGNVFNSLISNAEEQQDFFRKVVAYAKNNQKISMLKQSLNKLDDISQNWGLNNKQKRDLYSFVIENIEEHHLLQEIKFNLMVKFLTNYESQDIDANEQQNIQKYLVSLLTQENIITIQSTLLESAAFQFLQSKNLPIAVILSSFIKGDLNKYLEFIKANPNVLKELQIDEQQCLKFVRIKAISQYVETGDTIKFEQFAEKLQINKEEVEQWVIFAIQYKLITAQIDEYSETIQILSNNNKYFQKQDWVDLDKQLQDTIGKLEAVYEQI